MGQFKDRVDSLSKSRFSELELKELFGSKEDQDALARVKSVLGQHTDDLAAANDFIQKGSAVIGVLAKLARRALGTA